MKNKTCVIIVGPTAVGKTSLAIEFARYFNTEIISADSRQCFRELSIGVAKPSPEQLQQVPHWFVNSHSVLDEVSAKTFEEYALQKAAGIFKEHDVAIVAGGTGLYIKAFCDGLDEVPEIDPEIREITIAEYKSNGLQWLQAEIRKKDPLFYAKGEIQNPQRMMRALEVKLSTGRSIAEFQSHKKEERHFSIVKIGIELPKEQLHQNINDRVDEMMASGLLNEVKGLSTFKNLNALQTVGYRELFDHMDGKISLEKAIEQIRISTRQYAKRQMTWFKKDKEIKWVNAENIPAIVSQLMD